MVSPEFHMSDARQKSLPPTPTRSRGYPTILAALVMFVTATPLLSQSQQDSPHNTSEAQNARSVGPGPSSDQNPGTVDTNVAFTAENLLVVQQLETWRTELPPYATPFPVVQEQARRQLQVWRKQIAESQHLSDLEKAQFGRAYDKAITQLKEARDREAYNEAIAQLQLDLYSLLKDRLSPLKKILEKAARERAVLDIEVGNLSHCSQIGLPAVEPLISALSLDPNQSPGSRGPLWRRGVLCTIVEIGPSAQEPLIRFLLNNQPGDTAWTYAARALHEIGDPNSARTLLGFLEDDAADWRLRSRAAMALGEIQDRSAVGPLMKILQDGHVSSEAIHALGKIGDSSATECLKTILDDESKPLEARRQATMALGRIGVTSALERLREMANSEDIDVQTRAEVVDILRNSTISLGKPLYATLPEFLTGDTWFEDRLLNFIPDVHSCLLVPEARRVRGIAQCRDYNASQARIHPVILLDVKGDITRRTFFYYGSLFASAHAWNSLIPDSWRANRLEELELVVVLKEDIVTTEHPYIHWSGYGGRTYITIRRHQYRLNVTLYVASTGVVVDHKTFEGSVPPSPKFKIVRDTEGKSTGVTLEDIEKQNYTGNRVGSDHVLAWLAPFVVREQ